MRWDELQVDFSGGEVGGQVVMREDLEMHRKSVLTMENYIPTLQGTALRAPGSRFVQEMGDLAARIVPFNTPDNRRSLIEVSSGSMLIHFGIVDEITNDASEVFSPRELGPTLVPSNVVPNSDFAAGFAGWDQVPLGATFDFEFGTLGWRFLDSRGVLLITTGTEETAPVGPQVATLEGSATFPDAVTDFIIRPDIKYVGNAFSTNGPYTAYVRIRRQNNDLIDEWALHDTPGQGVGYVWNTDRRVTAAVAPGEVLKVQFYLRAGAVQTNSTPTFELSKLQIIADVTLDSISTGTTGAVPAYTPEELEQLHFVQSPYPTSITGNSYGMELVITHPNYPPARIYFDGVNYVFEELPISSRDDNDLLTPGYEPNEWGDSYPATCTSFLGRLVLAGGKATQLFGPSQGTPAQTTWTTEVGSWDVMTDPANAEVLATDSVIFTTTYRSPINWVLGQRFLLIGSEEYEYAAYADGIFQPGDLGIRLQSTHGSARVQPVPMGQYVLFPADNGSRVRAMKYLAEDESWVAPDLTIYHPQLFRSGIKRMVRVRNPHQMCAVLMGSGQIALLHLDTYSNISGWSRLNISGIVKDICVAANSEGDDVLFAVVERVINGVRKSYLEAFVNWTYSETWTYMHSATAFVAPAATNIITGLAHLEGEFVHVMVGTTFYGLREVIAGQIELVDDLNLPINVEIALVGLPQICTLKTLPLISVSPDAKKKYNKISVRCLFSSRPIINGERPSTRAPVTPQNISQPPDILYDSQIAVLGHDAGQFITIQENIPIRSEVIGIFGRVEGHDL